MLNFTKNIIISNGSSVSGFLHNGKIVLCQNAGNYFTKKVISTNKSVPNSYKPTKIYADSCVVAKDKTIVLRGNQISIT